MLPSSVITPLLNSWNQLTTQPPHTPYDRSGIYSLTCCTCQQAYVGQTSWSLKLRYQEHTRSIRNNNLTSAYSLHILQNRHEYGPMNTTKDLLKPLSTPSLLIPHELFFIQSFHKEGKLISKQNPAENNPLIQLALNASHEPPTWKASQATFSTQWTQLATRLSSIATAITGMCNLNLPLPSTYQPHHTARAQTALHTVPYPRYQRPSTSKHHVPSEWHNPQTDPNSGSHHPPPHPHSSYL